MVVGAKGKVEAIVPEPAVLEYIAATPVDPYAVEGEIVVGAVLPEQVTLYEVPGSPYGYTIVNGNKVDPMRIKLPQGKVFKGQELAAFEAERNRIDALLEKDNEESNRFASR